ncbi:hypothetical protein P8452_27291 [Trifolium repens]|nr:hypothetical protein P8452_27291 [Trifolium repens]
MDSSHISAYANFSCELRIKQARNVEFIKSTKNLFARLYLPTGNNKRIQLNSKNVSTKSLPFWDESFNLDLEGSDCKEGMFKTPEVEVEIKVRVALVAEMEKQNKKRLNNWNECGCKNGHDHQVWCNTEDCDIFALGAALEAF